MDLKYKVISNDKQYYKYCNILEELISEDEKKNSDEIDLLSLLIDSWDEKKISMHDLNPIELIQSLMKENNINSIGLAKILGLSKSTVSKILNYKKGLSKGTIRKLSDYFKISQESLNKPYVKKDENKFEYISV